MTIDFLLNPFCIKVITIYLSAGYFAVMYLYKEIKFKPNINLYLFLTLFRPMEFSTKLHAI